MPTYNTSDLWFNLADILSKHWSYQIKYDGLLKYFIYFKGDTGRLFDTDLLYFECCTDIFNNNILLINGK